VERPNLQHSTIDSEGIGAGSMGAESKSGLKLRGSQFYLSASVYGSAALNAELAGVLRAPHRAEAQRRKVSTFLFLILKLICPCELSLLLSL